MDQLQSCMGLYVFGCDPYTSHSLPLVTCRNIYSYSSIFFLSPFSSSSMLTFKSGAKQTNGSGTSEMQEAREDEADIYSALFR